MEEQELTDVAQSALPAVGTDALVGVESVDAGPSVATGVAGAVVDVLGGGGGRRGSVQTLSEGENELRTKWQHARSR